MRPPVKPIRRPVSTPVKQARVSSFDVSVVTDPSKRAPLAPPPVKGKPVALARGVGQPSRRAPEPPKTLDGELSSLQAFIRRQGMDATAAEEDRFLAVTKSTESTLANIKTLGDRQVVELLTVTAGMRDRAPRFQELFDRLRDTARDETIRRLAFREAVALGLKPPVKITKERPVYGKDVDARPESAKPVRLDKPVRAAVIAKPVKAIAKPVRPNKPKR